MDDTSRGWGLLLGHHWGPRLATNGDFATAMDTAMDEARFDPLIHAPQRLRICAMLSQAEGIEFSEILNRTGLSKSALSKQLTQLIDAGHLGEEQFLRAGSSRLMLSLTSQGHGAYIAHKKALEDIFRADDSSTSPTTT